MTKEEAKKMGATHYVQKRTRVQYWKNKGNRWLVRIGDRWVVADKSIYLDYMLEQAKPL